MLLIKKPTGSCSSAQWPLTGVICCCMLLVVQAASPLKPPQSTTGTLVSAYGDLVCDNQEIVMPTSTAEVAAAVSYYYNTQPQSVDGPAVTGGVPVKMRVASRASGFSALDGYRQMGFHDRSGFACAKSAARSAKTVTLLMQNMRRVLGRSDTIVRVQAGLTVTELMSYATRNNLTVPLGVVPNYADLSIGGLLATGAHGIGGSGSANLADIVTAITFVDGIGTTRRVARNSRVGRGLAGGLGMLGVITEVTLQLQPGLGRMTSWSTGPRSDANIAQELMQLWGKYEHLKVVWRPDLKQYSTLVLEEVPSDTPFDPPFINASLTPTGGFFHPQTDASVQLNGGLLGTMHSGQDSGGFICQLFGAGLMDSKRFGWVTGYRRGAGGAVERVMSDNGTGLINQMQTCDCDIPGGLIGSNSCFFDRAVWGRIWAKEAAAGKSKAQLTPSISVEETEFALNSSNLTAFIEDAKLMATNLLPGACWAGSALLLRTGAPTNDHIAPQAGSASDRFMWVEHGQFRTNIPLSPQQQGMKPRLQKKTSALQEYFEQLMTCKYKARPHWGKSWPRVWTQKACPIRNLHPRFATQIALQRDYDPTKMFETQMLRAVITRGAANSGGPACTNELECYCKVDNECGAADLCCKTAPAGLSPYKVCLPC